MYSSINSSDALHSLFCLCSLAISCPSCSFLHSSSVPSALASFLPAAGHERRRSSGGAQPSLPSLLSFAYFCLSSPYSPLPLLLNLFSLLFFLSIFSLVSLLSLISSPSILPSLTSSLPSAGEEWQPPTSLQQQRALRAGRWPRQLQDEACIRPSRHSRCSLSIKHNLSRHYSRLSNNKHSLRTQVSQPQADGETLN